MFGLLLLDVRLRGEEEEEVVVWVLPNRYSFTLKAVRSSSEGVAIDDRRL
jgi:hypothetical protein